MNGWIVVARIRLLSTKGYAESSPFVVAVEDPDSAIELVRQAFPIKDGVEIVATEPLSARDLAVLGLQEGEIQARTGGLKGSAATCNADSSGLERGPVGLRLTFCKFPRGMDARS